MDTRVLQVEIPDDWTDEEKKLIVDFRDILRDEVPSLQIATYLHSLEQKGVDVKKVLDFYGEIAKEFERRGIN